MNPRIKIEPDGQRVAHCEHFVVRSAFQPIISVAHQRVVGYEGLARVTNGDGVALLPADLFNAVDDIESLVAIDRACREIHMSNFAHADLHPSWLFLNVHPMVAMHGHQFGPFFAQILQQLQIDGWQIVIEIVEAELPDESLLYDTIALYRSLGCLVALDDFGVGGSQFTRLWRIDADIVKLDRSLILEAEQSVRAQRTLPSLVAMIHEAGSLVLQEGIETPRQLELALSAGVDLLQGFGLARPALIEQDEPFNRDFLIQGLAASTLETDRVDSMLHQQIMAVTERFEDMLVALERNVPLEVAAQAILSIKMVARVFVLDGEGRQQGDTVNGIFAPQSIKSRFRPLAKAKGASWAKRPYFRRAMIEQGVVQISRPYLSVAGGNLCRTISYARPHVGHLGIKVVCCDINWTDL
ncbi:MAG: EAL domain-containing protein [Halothiobacillus sp.]|jgi:EAL domain-containing protein (putative c-di-GMP-specific phosphodiesterase class I)|uniref:sensor domain-containing phosphodiesterase n=1 Tax=Halothiobacillus sp. TaxID=1891311 RepID=UPI002AD3A2E4|nr:EAL domain-containing protein [Halothiobacillus sp.]MDA3878722.1 EAL domain-containing protein [Halothiobacillus sp.]